MKVLILGGGFGLYGYLPALSELEGVSIILPSRYKERLKQRDDINSFYNMIEWIDNGENLLELCEGLIIAVPPTQQFLWVKRCLYYKNITHLLLEKPLASTPSLALDLMRELECSGKKFRIAYNFRHTCWGESTLRHAKGIKSITWNFQAHHYKQNIQTWKRRYSEGGGALRFYGIHLIALLSELGYTDVCYSKIEAKEQHEAEIWSAGVTRADHLSPCVINIATNSKETVFQLSDNNGHIISLLDPFQTKLPSEATSMDQRIPYLTKILHDLFYGEKYYYDWYGTTNLLWHTIEQRILQ